MNGRAALFSIVGMAAYTVAHYFSWPLFRYYPAVNRFSFAADESAGFSILWYGWIATAILAGLVAAFAVPRRWSDRLPPDLCWMVLSAMMVAVVLYEKRWFLI